MLLGGDNGVTTAGISAFQKYLQGSGGLILDAPMINGELSADRSGVFVPFLPAKSCSYLSHNKTSFTRIDPAEPVFDDGVAATFDVTLSQYFRLLRRRGMPDRGRRRFQDLVLFAGPGRDAAARGRGGEPTEFQRSHRRFFRGHSISGAPECGFQASLCEQRAMGGAHSARVRHSPPPQPPFRLLPALAALRRLGSQLRLPHRTTPA